MKFGTKFERNRTINGGVIVILVHTIWAPSAILDLTGSKFSQFRGLCSWDHRWNSLSHLNTIGQCGAEVLVIQSIHTAALSGGILKPLFLRSCRSNLYRIWGR